jgi:hypothetical protein
MSHQGLLLLANLPHLTFLSFFPSSSFLCRDTMLWQVVLPRPVMSTDLDVSRVRQGVV